MMDAHTNGDDSDSDFAIQVGLKPEYFVTSNVSVSVLMGLELFMEGDNRGVSNTGSTSIRSFADPMANAAISWYFD